MAIRRSDIVIDTGDLKKLIRAFKDYPPLLLKTLPAALRKELRPHTSALRRDVAVKNWAHFTRPVTTRRIPKKFNSVGIRIKPKNNIAYVFEYGFAHRKVNKKGAKRPVYNPWWNRLTVGGFGSTNIKDGLIREGKAQLIRALDKQGVRRI